jgi:4-amino-4-deoxy-L-arabinose transferase-like glycosyltransferase
MKIWFKYLLLISLVIYLPYRYFAFPYGLRGQYYPNPSWQGDPRLTVIDPEIFTAPLNKYRSLFPENQFSIQWKGFIVIEKSGEYTFATASDDGSYLIVKDQQVVDNGGNHGLKRVQGQIYLKAGIHPIQVKYFQGGGAYGMELLWARENKSLEDIPYYVLLPDPVNYGRYKLVRGLGYALGFLKWVWLTILAYSLERYLFRRKVTSFYGRYVRVLICFVGLYLLGSFFTKDIWLGILIYFYPILFGWVILYFFFQELASRSLIDRDWRIRWLLTCTAWGTLLVVIIEGISLFHLLVRSVFVFSWLIADSILLVITLRFWQQRTRQSLGGLWTSIRQKLLDFDLQKLTPSFLQVFLVGSSGMVVVALLVNAFFSAPNTYDSLTYHLPRIMQWMQNQSVAHFPTNNIRQISLNPWAEFAMMALYLLSDSDVYVAGVQWFSMLSSLVGVSLIANLLSEQPLAPIFAALGTLSIPMGVLQATSTQNDYVVTFWLVCFYSFGLLLMKKPGNRIYLLGVSLSLGLAILTKGTAYLFAPPFFLWLIIALFRKRGWRTVVPHYLIPLIGIVLLVNAGHFSRNLALFRSPLGPHFYVQNEIFGLGPTVSNLIRNISLHTAIGPKTLTKTLNNLLLLLHNATGQDINDERTTYFVEFHFTEENVPHENSVGNPLHLLGIIATILYFARPSYIRLHPRQVIYGLCLMAAFILFNVYLKWQPWHSRLHLPLFVLWTPLVSILLTENLPKRWARISGGFLILYAGYWMIFNQTRPLFSDASYFRLPREEQYFIDWPNPDILHEQYKQLVGAIISTNCHTIGLINSGENREYPLWVMLKERSYKVHIEQILIPIFDQGLSAPLRKQPFTPCLLVSLAGPLSSLVNPFWIEQFESLKTQFPVEKSFGPYLSISGPLELLGTGKTGPDHRPPITPNTPLGN